MGFSFFPQHYCRLIITDEIIDSGVTVHTMGRIEEHADENKLKITVFNTDKARQDKAGQTHRNTGSNE